MKRPSKPRTDRGGTVEPRKVLVVEDSRAFCMALRQFLEQDGDLAVVTCGSLAELRRAVERERDFAIAVVDLNLPDAPYGEALDVTIQEGIPSIVFTGRFDAKTRTRIMEREVIDYVLKDNELALGTLVATVRRAIANRDTRILVVDDMVSTRALLARMLTIQQYDVLEAGSGAEALAMLETHRDIDLVVADYVMPDMDGFELTRRIRRRFPAGPVRVIGISSSLNPTVSAGFLKAGAHDFISRPFIPEELQCRIANNAETLAQIRKLQNLASRDYLTDLYNRRYFFEQGPKLVAEAKLQGRRSSLAIVDVDHFKQLNDTLGHDVGDRALRLVAERLLAAVADTDALVTRLGGEEFGIVFPGVAPEEAFEWGERIRASIRRPEVLGELHLVRMTVSIGLVGAVEAEHFERDLNRADAALYAAKQAGRDRVMMHDSRRGQAA